MNLTPIQLSWTVAVGAVLVSVLTLVMFLRLRSRRAGRSGEVADSWERGEERRRRREMVYGISSYTLLFCCAGVAAALSFHGLVGFGVENLGLSGGWEYLVPFGLDGAAMFCSVLAVREASHGDAALGSRLLVWVFAVASAWFNWVHAPRGVSHDGAPQFFAGMSVSAAILFDRALKQTRRAALREQGLVPRPLPQIRIVRWLRAPRETFAAWSLMLLENVRSLDEAVDEVREEREARQEARLRTRSADRRERAELKAIARRGGPFSRARGSRALAGVAVAVTSEGRQGGSDPLPAVGPDHPGGLSRAGAADLARRPARSAARSVAGPEVHRGGLVEDGPEESVTVDLTADDDTLSLPKLDALERKLRAIEQQLG
ncbi:DUF2637 domain-containing protein [Streptomyces sp. BE20]|uniref:DUF2637 domain-containing protein n=1 Tax=Streptomyces sp. BE20 TaxID=3002525 RepID=UPI002E7865E0|nr:DUF2637 domain-containing protein [Streptomyces sp. BE20]MEE1825214.1 DUF2637 domain-containing protein [Streptomyces sp. BE20]